MKKKEVVEESGEEEEALCGFILIFKQIETITE